MSKKVSWGIAIIILVVAGYIAYQMITSKRLSPADVAEFRDGDFVIQVYYSRPYKKGRLIFGDESRGALVPYGKKWRTGANEATEINLSGNVVIDGQLLKAGRYSLYTIPGAEAWTVVFNSRLDYWGAQASGDPFDKCLDVARVIAITTTTPETEQFTISFTPADSVVNMSFTWDKTRAVLPIQQAR